MSNRTLLVVDGDGEFKLEIPADYTVTFGPTIPYEPKNGFNSSNHYSLRVYEGASKAKLLAVFGGVQHFRDSQLSVSRKIVEEVGRTVWKSEKDGYKVEEAVQRKHSWEDELAVKALPAPRKRRK